jgi:hypothetical protein
MRIAAPVIVGIGSQNYEVDTKPAQSVSVRVDDSGFPEPHEDHEDYWRVPDDNDSAEKRGWPPRRGVLTRTRDVSSDGLVVPSEFVDRSPWEWTRYRGLDI